MDCARKTDKCCNLRNVENREGEEDESKQLRGLDGS